MIDTIQTKGGMETQGFYERGSGPEEILIVGSCRTIAFMSYLVRWNESIGQNRFTIRRMDPCEWIEVGIQERLARAETDERILSVLKNSKIFIHEFLTNYGMMNTDIEAEKSIYDFGLEPEIDIAIPNFNDHIVLKEDYTAYGVPTPPDWIERGEAEILKFHGVCRLSSFPEFGDHFVDTWRKIRYFWRPNHTAATFTTELFRRMNDRYLKLETNHDFWSVVMGEDLFRDPHTAVTDEDRAGYRLEW